MTLGLKPNFAVESWKQRQLAKRGDPPEGFYFTDTGKASLSHPKPESLNTVELQRLLAWGRVQKATHICLILSFGPSRKVRDSYKFLPLTVLSGSAIRAGETIDSELVYASSRATSIVRAVWSIKAGDLARLLYPTW